MATESAHSSHGITARAATPAGALQPQVWVVDDDALLTELLVGTLVGSGLRVRGLTDSADLLELADRLVEHPCVLLCDLQMPGMDGITLARALRQRGFAHPIVLMSAHLDVDSMLEAMREGFLQVVRKPLDLPALAGQMREALQQAEQDWQRRQTVEGIQQQIDKLTVREQEVVHALGLGLMNKQVADRLDLSVKTIEAHRQRIMAKLGLRTANELIRFSIEWRLLTGGIAADAGGSSALSG
ncbi:MAG: DNA-binding response regulator [Lysobacteraceae bacterium]|nr:MAG: DNA-binding response regulator [Xanthomonadaceae bacterium]